MRKRMQYWWIGGGVILLLVIGGIGWLFYGAGTRVAEQWLPRWSEENVRTIRYEAVAADSARSLRLKNWEYGPIDDPLLKAPAAELTVHPPFAGRFGKWSFQEWKLQDVTLRWHRTAKGWTVNGRPIGVFLQEFLQFPNGPQNETVPVEAVFRVMDDRQVEILRGSCRMTSRLNAKGDSRLYTLQIQYGDGERSGTLQLVIHPAARTLECESDGAMTLDFLRRLAAASGAPVKSLRLLHPEGSVQGKGKFRFSFPELQIVQLQYEGEAAAGNFALGAFSFDHGKPTAFQLQTGSAPGSETALTIAETVLETPLRLELKQLTLCFRHDLPVIRFSCACDLTPAFNAGLWKFGGEKLRMPWPLDRQLQGSYNSVTGAWQFTTRPLRSGRQILSVSGDHAVVHADADHFELKGEGKRLQGTIEANASFRNLRLAVGKEALETSGGSVQSRWMVNFANSGPSGGVISGTLDFDLADLLLASSQTRCVSLVQPMGSMDLAPATEETLPAYHLMLRSNAIATTGWDTALDAGHGTYEISINRQAENGGWNLPLLHGRFDGFKVRSSRHDLALGKLELSGNAELNPDWSFRNFHVRSTAERAAGQLALLQVDGKGVEGTIDWRNQDAPAWNNVFSFRTLQATLRNWHGTLEQAQLTASGGGDPLLCEKPDKASLQAKRLHVLNQETKRSLDLRNADFALAVDGSWSQNRLQAKTAFDKAVLVLGPNGHWESGRTTLQWQGGVKDGVAEPGKCTFAAQRFGWRGSLAALGAETMQGELAMTFRNGDLAWKMLLDGSNLSLTGEKFSLLMPGGKLTADSLADGSGAAGHVQFADGNGMLEWGKVMLDNVSLDTDWRLGGPRTDLKTLPRGKFAIGKVLFSNGASGSVQGSLAQAGAALDATGELHSDLVKNFSTLSFTADWEQELQWCFAYDFPKTKLARMIDLETWFPQAAAVRFGGTVAMRGRFEGDRDGFRSSGSAELENTDWQFGNWATLEGVSAKVEFSDLANLVSASGAVPLQFRRFRWHDWLLEDGEGRLSFLPGSRIAVEQLNAGFAGGRVQSRQPITFSTVEKTRLQEIELPFTAEKISPLVMMPLLGMTRIESDFALSGTVNAVLRKAQMRYHASQLEFNGENGFLGARHAEQFAVQTNDPVYRDFTLAVLAALRCTRAQFAFENIVRHGKELLQMKIAVDGRPAEPVPFVYQGSSAEAPFRPAEKDERGFDGEVELSVELQLPCRDVTDGK